MGSTPATMEAAKYADFIGCCPGNASQQADAELAYIQVDIQGTPSWMCLLEHLRPASWAGVEFNCVFAQKGTL